MNINALGPVATTALLVHRAAISVGVLLVVAMILATSVTRVAAASTIPPGYSSEIIDVKFRDDGAPDVLKTTQGLPPHLQSALSSMTKLFSLPKASLNVIRARGASRSRRALPDLDRWFRITLRPGTDAAVFLDELRRLPGVEIAEPAPLPQPPPAITPDFTANQGYLDAAPGGIDARFAWTIPGGNGSGVRIYDVEYSWNQAHEDLSAASGVSLLLNPGDSAIDPFGDDNHGTAVLGEIIADNDAKGVTGISWGASVGLAPANTMNLGYNPANAILLAVADGGPGDVILLEQQFPVCGLPGFGPSEWVTAVFDAIQTAVANGIVVVEAAGNGNVDLDQAACGTAFDRTVRDSGAIIVGAGRPPSSGLDRQRETFSTYGSRVDVQGWGSGVTTTGYGMSYVNPDDPANPDFWYTAGFNGTSSASPMAAGAAANLQGIALMQVGTALTPFEVRDLLVLTGSPQLGDTTEHIGPRPNLREAISLVCFGRVATIFVRDGMIVGGPDAGRLYRGVLRGTQGDDVIVGTADGDLIKGFGGDDVICGGEGHDRIEGGDGNDLIDGGDGNDLIKGQNGDDVIHGGGGNDHIEGGSGDDHLDGGPGINALKGQAGTDTCVSGQVVTGCP